MIELEDYSGRVIRLTDERLEHIERRPELRAQQDRIKETLRDPDEIRESDHDESVHSYYRHYSSTPVTEKWLTVISKVAVDDPFVITAFYTDRIKSGAIIDRP